MSYRVKRLLRLTVGHWFNMMMDIFFWKISQKEFVVGMSKAKNLEDNINFLWQYAGKGFYKKIKPNQDKWELLTLSKKVEAIKPEVIVEIGTRNGGTLFMWSRCAKALKILISIDLPGGIHGGGYCHQRERLYRSFVRDRMDCKAVFLRMNSQCQETKKKVLESLCGREIDFLFIDGDHRYAGVKKDYELYVPLVKSGGIIAFHDIRPNFEVSTIEVFRLWDELKKNNEFEEIVHEPYGGHFGIGLLIKK